MNDKHKNISPFILKEPVTKYSKLTTFTRTKERRDVKGDKEKWQLNTNF